jgi:hypothetical protein
MPVAPAVSCALGIGKKHTSNNEHTGITRHSRTQWFYGLFRALPGDRAFCHRRLRTNVLSAPGRADPTSANLTPASGRQDHTTSPYAAAPFVSSPFDCSQIFRPALHHVARLTLPRPPHPTPRFVTIMIRPLWAGMGKVLELIWGEREAEYFFGSDWTSRLGVLPDRRPNQ